MRTRDEEYTKLFGIQISKVRYYEDANTLCKRYYTLSGMMNMRYIAGIRNLELVFVKLAAKLEFTRNWIVIVIYPLWSDRKDFLAS